MTGHMKTKILIVAYPTQGHINPSLRFANRLVKLNVDVTYCTSVSVIRRIDIQSTHHGLTFVPFSDGNDNGIQPTTIWQQFFLDFSTNGASAVAELISSAATAGQPFDHVVYSSGVPWAAKVAKAHGLESSLLWCQAAIVLNIYYYYFNSYQDLISCNNNNPTFPIDLPGLPSLTVADLPSFMLPSCLKEHKFILEFMKDHVDVLKISPRILVNTFDELEVEAMKAIEKLVVLPVGPLVPSEFLDGNGLSYNSIGCDLFEKPVEDYIKWLNAKQKSSVVYVSFGSLATLSIEQVEEMASGLVESGRPFLWVIRDGDQVGKLSKIEELKKQGMIVSWCSQVEVLTHEAIGCFVMHGGWNSTVEALAAGVPTVVFSQWSDQAINAKMIEDVWKTGVKVKRREGDGMVERKEIKRCVEMVMEDEEMRRNAEKWRELARQALGNGGSSAVNLQAFVDDVQDKTIIYKNGQDEHVKKGF
ncbi:putative crocetin glucosyltransferase [Helianthus annuus]|nr:putative crocetin glucosyltransferase [Helianthus annuus]KAJ0467840.1 putative crocetin glucosyltransferase [Helianthus annuus]